MSKGWKMAVDAMTLNPMGYKTAIQMILQREDSNHSSFYLAAECEVDQIRLYELKQNRDIAGFIKTLTFHVISMAPTSSLHYHMLGGQHSSQYFESDGYAHINLQSDVLDITEVFRSLNNPTVSDIIVTPEAVPDILKKIKEAQMPEQDRIFKDRRDREKRQSMLVKEECRIITLPGAA
jgi:hypothetical protein